jgi:FAD/FMN-containing dehydrogenase/Fe-S oxidoreductase
MTAVKVDIAHLESSLRNKIKDIRFDNGSKALYAADASNYRQVPIGITYPHDKEEVMEIVKICREYNAPLLSRGGGTSLAGQCCNYAVIMDFSRYMNKILEINVNEKYAVVQPGVVLDNLREEAKKNDLTFGPDPATHNHCTLGGMMGNNSCGIHSVMAGKTVDNVIELEILTYDGTHMQVSKTSNDELENIIKEGGRKGEIYSILKSIRDRYADKIRKVYPQIPRRVSGYNLDDLLPENDFNVAKALIGTESTCVVILEAKVKLVPWPKKQSLLVLGYEDIFTAADHVPEIMKSGPIGLEGIDNLLVNYMEKKGLHTQDTQYLPEGKAWLLVEFGGKDKEESDNKAKELMNNLKKSKNSPSMKLFTEKNEEEHVWEIRESGLGATAHIPGMHDTWPGWEDSAVSPEREGDYLRDLKKLFHKYNYTASVYGHLGQGCIHCRIPFDLRTEQGIKTYRSFVEEAADLVVSYNGSLSGEHGDGQSRAELLVKMYGEDILNAFREFKSAWDPDWKMNPGKVVNPNHLDDNLRLGAGYSPKITDTYFKYPSDDGFFSKATLRCVGVGKCRREGGGTMCPSYMVTHEEMHSTRGRAHLLFEMLRGDVIKNGWKDEHVKEALDLCLACKGCKKDCPVDVDMATYKAEFLAHYYKGSIRPRHAYAFGLIYWGAKIGSSMPGLTNFITQTPGLRGFAKFAAGMAQQRKIPPFAETTFRKWYKKNNKEEKTGSKKVLLWPDTFNNNFHPETLVAAKEVLESSGYTVEIPKISLCCGRPLYDYGMLNLAKKLLRQILNALQPAIREGVPLVGIEPSCLAVFRDELTELFPNNEDAQRLKKNSFTISEFLTGKAEDFKFPTILREAVVHGHCHHKAIMGMSDEQEVLKKIGLNYEVLTSGCCGMAGAFGFEKEKYDVSVKCGERVLLPAVRKAEKETFIIADGFSCRTQISELTDRKALHIAEVLHMGLKNKQTNIPDEYPDSIKKNM